MSWFLSRTLIAAQPNLSKLSQALQVLQVLGVVQRLLQILVGQIMILWVVVLIALINMLSCAENVNIFLVKAGQENDFGELGFLVPGVEAQVISVAFFES